MTNLYYDIECYPNFFSITFLDDADTCYVYSLFNNEELHLGRSNVRELIIGKTLIGFNSKAYDNWMFDYFLTVNKLDNERLKKCNDEIINSDSYSVYTTMKSFLPKKYKRNYNWIDLFNRNPYLKTSLKTYQHYKRIDNISETPIDFNSRVKEEEIKSILDYNLQDVKATLMMYNEVKPLLDSLDDLRETYNAKLPDDFGELVKDSIPDLKSLTGGKIVDSFFGGVIRPDSCPDSVILNLHQNIDFDIEDKVVREHLLSLNNLPEKVFSKKQIMDGFDINAVIVAQTKSKFDATILNAEITFNLGGLHSTIPPLQVASDDEYVIVDYDVNGMYPNVIQKQKIVPFYFTEQQKSDFLILYKELINKRDKLKEEKSPLQESYKLLLNTLTGKFRERYSVLFDPSCHIKTCIYSQYFIWSVLEKLKPYTKLICQVNTDGFTLYVNRANLTKIDEILNNTNGIIWKAKQYKSFHSRDCNNYCAVDNEGVVKTKGSIFSENTISIPSIIKKALINNLLYDIPVETTIMDCNDIFDFLYFTKPQGKITIQDTPFNGKVVRFAKVIDGYTIKNNGKKISNGESVLILNTIDRSAISNIDRNFYIKEANDAVSNIKGHKHDPVINLFNKFGIKLIGKTPTQPKDGIILYKGNQEKSKPLSEYETVGVNMLKYPELLYIDIDHIDDSHRDLIKLCLDANTIYSTTDIENDSYRFFFYNSRPDIIAGLYRWKNIQGETSVELWNQVDNQVCLSGLKRTTVEGEIIERYVIKGEDLKPLPDAIFNWIMEHPYVAEEYKPPVKSKVKVETNNFNHTDDMVKLFELMQYPGTSVDTIKSKAVIRFNKPPAWFAGGGDWRQGTLTLHYADEENLSIYLSKFKNSFTNDDKKQLLGEIQPFVDNINKTRNIVPLEKVELSEEDIANSIKGIVNEIPQEVYDNLPELLKTLTKGETGRVRDALLLSLITCNSVYFSNIWTRYDNNKMYPNLISCVVGESASGKSIIKKGRIAPDILDRNAIKLYEKETKEYKLIDKKQRDNIDTPVQVRWVTSGDATEPGLRRLIKNNPNHSLLVFAPEADTLTKNAQASYGNWYELLRLSYDNDTIDPARSGEESNRIDEPKMSICTSGTFTQMDSLTGGKKGLENGTFNRFLFYIFHGEFKLRNPLLERKVNDEDFKKAGNELCEFYNKYLCYTDAYRFELTLEQSKSFWDNLNGDYDEAVTFNEDSVKGVILRHYSSAMKIMIQFAGLRLMENGVDSVRYNVLNISNSDFNCVIKLINTLSKHAILLFNELKPIETDVVLTASWQETVWNKLKTAGTPNITRQILIDMVKRDYNRESSSVDRWISKLIKNKKVIKNEKNRDYTFNF